MKKLKQSKQCDSPNTYFFKEIQVLALTCFAALLFGACSNDDSKDPVADCGIIGANWVSLVQKELKVWNTAATTYAAAQTPINCNNYKGATNEYLDALEKAKKCVPEAALTEFNQAIQYAREDLQQLDCQ